MALRKRNPNRPNPDLLENPTPKVAPGKTVVDKVLNFALAAGNGAVTVMAGLLAGVLVLYSGYVLYDTFHTQYNAYSSAWDLLQYKPEYITDNQSPLSANALEDINQDYRGWLTVYDTSIDYPVVQGEDDQFYAWHNIYKQSSLSGAIYLAAMNSPDFSDSYNVVYGHHMDNGAMFGRLDSYRDEEFYNAHRDGIIVTKSGAYDFRLFAVVKTDAYEDRIYQVGDRCDDVLDFLASGGEGGVGIGTELLFYDESLAKTATQVITLSTCASAETSGRLAVLGKMTKRKMVSVDVADNEFVYDGEPHMPDPKVNMEDAKVQYSTDGGKTWTDEVPSITDVGELTVTVRAESPVDGTVEETVTVRVTPKPVVVKANDISKTEGQADPQLTATVTGLIGDDKIDYVLSRETGENPGGYAIKASGDANQGNYSVTYESGMMTVNAGSGSNPGTPSSGELTIGSNGYEGEYDGQPHTLDPKPSKPDAKLEYSTDGGKTWTDEAPSVKDVGELTVIIRGEDPDTGAKTEKTVVMKVTPKPVTVKANDAAKIEGQDDPLLTATVTGLIGDDKVNYVLYRESGDNPGAYTITATGDTYQGNYVVTYDSGTMTVAEAGSLVIDVNGYEGEYDGQTHTLDPKPSDPDAKLEYSTDGGKTWTDEAPSVKDVGELTVIIRGEDPDTGAKTEKTVVMKVTPKLVNVRVNDVTKTFGEQDPQLTATVDGLLGDDSIEYALTREGGEGVGTYNITASGDEKQGNYVVTYTNGTMTIEKAKGLGLTATGYEGKPDGKPHGVTANVKVTQGTMIEYSTDGGKTWTSDAPTITDEGEMTVLVRATNPDYETETATVTLRLTGKTISLTVRKVWENDRRRNRPSSVTMVLTGGGEVRTVTLGAGNKWTATIKDLPADVQYEWLEPSVTGYTTIMEGIDKNNVTTVRNVRQEPQQTGTNTVVRTGGGGGTATRSNYNLTIRYTFADGSQAFEPVTLTVRQGESYSVPSPVKEGYAATPETVSGTMGAGDRIVTVIYAENLVEIGENGTPLGANSVHSMLEGDCFE